MTVINRNFIYVYDTITILSFFLDTYKKGFKRGAIPLYCIPIDIRICLIKNIINGNNIYDIYSIYKRLKIAAKHPLV